MRTLCLILFCLFTFSCQQGERACNDFKTGTFEFEEFIGGQLKKTTFTRNDTLEVDFFDQKIDSFAVRWINDCEYIVRSLRPKTPADERAVHFKILSTEGDTYTFEYALVIKKNKSGKRISRKGTARKISD